MFCASLLISVATTENPFPASPALAASIEAFNDNNEVSSEIFAIKLVIPVISLEASPTLRIASTSNDIESRISSIAVPTNSISLRPLRAMPTVLSICDFTCSLSRDTSETTPLRSVALSAISLIDSEICSTVSLKAAIEAACAFEASCILTDTTLLLSAWFLILSDTALILQIISRIYSVNIFTLC